MCFSMVKALAAAMILSLSVGLAQAADNNGPQPDLRTAIMEVARQNIPAVVHIEVTQRQDVASPFLPFQNDPSFRYFFDIPRMPRKFKQELKGIGTGMVLNTQGHILTNNHVVSGANKIQVLLSSGKEYSGKVVGTDPKTDLAVVQISAKELPQHVTFGDSDKVGVGEWVVAIGHPRGLSHTVTQGIISAKHRRGIMDPSSYQDFLQTDAAINPGNSGGPLLNLRGEVIGVNAAIASESGGFEGIGFAIPSNMALYVAKALIMNGKVLRGWLGVSIQELTPEIAKSLGLESTKGTLIADVIKGGPADKAGIKRGDVVIAYDGKSMPDVSTLQNEVALSPIGQQVKVIILRESQKKDFVVKVGNQDVLTKMLTASLKERLGALVRPITSQEAEKYGLGLEDGVAISWVDSKGPLGEVGFEKQDIILELQGESIKGMESFVDMVSSLPGNQKITLLALDHRTGQTGYVQAHVR
ncbi:MAG: Do family serine endopeptidase [Pseudomonadota bacterium]